MKHIYLSAAEYAQIAGCHERSVRRMADQKRWKAQTGKARKRKAVGAGRREWEFHSSLFPADMQSRILAAHQSAANDSPTVNAISRDAIWLQYETATEKQKQSAQLRLDVLNEIERLQITIGLNESAALRNVATERGLSASTIWNWKAQLEGVDRSDWLAGLVPKFDRNERRADIHPEAWNFFLSDWLRPEKPAITACYRRLVKQAKTEGWEPIPHERSLRRRLKAEVPQSTIVLKREGRDKAKTLMPAQRRTVSGLHAMEAVNMDGHKFDVFVNWEGHEKPIRPTLVALQDLYSRKFVAWRLSDSENKETVRLVIGDMVEQWGIPDLITMDNGRSFASKWISGGFANRFRFKVNKTDPNGLLVALGIGIHWAQPGHGQAKPIERAFRDLAESIAKHPLCSGAYTGNSPMAKPDNYGKRAIDRAVFVELVNQEIAEHNARVGRTTEMAKGRSFDQVFAQSYENAIVRWPTSGQRSLWLMAADKIRAQRGSGEIHFHGNRYWNGALSGYAGQQLIIRFDPDHLHKPLRVYDTKDSFICDADLIADTGFYSKSDARLHARDMKALLRSTKEQSDLIAKMDAATLGRMMQAKKLEPDTPAAKPRPKVTRIATRTSNLAEKPVFEPDTQDDIDVEAAFGAGLRVVHGGRDDENFD